jgi:hypothetical protein
LYIFFSKFYLPAFPAKKFLCGNFITFRLFGDVFAARIRACEAKTKAGKMCRSNGVGMSEANDLAVAEAEPP